MQVGVQQVLWGLAGQPYGFINRVGKGPVSTSSATRYHQELHLLLPSVESSLRVSRGRFGEGGIWGHLLA